MDVKTLNNIAASVYVQDRTKLVCQSSFSSLLMYWIYSTCMCEKIFPQAASIAVLGRLHLSISFQRSVTTNRWSSQAKEPYFEGLCSVLDPFMFKNYSMYFIKTIFLEKKTSPARRSASTILKRRLHVLVTPSPLCR